MQGKCRLFHVRRNKCFFITLFSLLLTNNKTKMVVEHNFIHFVVLAVTKLT